MATPTFDSTLPSAGQKRGLPSVPAQDKGTKRRKLERRDQADHRSAATILPVAAFDRPPGMSKAEYIKQLQAKIAAENDSIY